MKSFFDRTPDEVMKEFNVTKNGLTSEKVQTQREVYGKNELSEGKKKSAFIVFLEQFKDLLIIILIIAGIISMVSGNLESTIVIFAVIILNAILGTVQYVKAEKSLASLKVLSSPVAKVMRDGVRMEVVSADIVPGDIVLLEAGDMVVADGRILDNFSLKVNESSLTGESEAVEKTAACIKEEKIALGDQKNMVFSGSLVTYGRATVIVTGTGMQTEIGKIADLMNQTKQRRTPLQVSLDDFSKKLATLILAICVLVFLLSWYRDMGILDSLMFAVALAVAAIPEALSSIVTIVQAMGTQKMAKQHAIIKELKAVESLGAVSVICSDKTGTLTQNKMSIQKLYADNMLFDKEELNLNNNAHYMLIKSAILVNDATVSEQGEIGDPTEVALIQLADHFGVDETIYREHHPRICELAFDSDRKLMSTVHDADGKYMLVTKGAIDVLLDRAVSVLTANGVVPMTEEMKQHICNVNEQLSREGLRVLTFGYREVENTDINFGHEKDFIFVGLVSMMDPPRPESVQAVADAKLAGIRTVMITGDHKVTATAIAKQIGIFENGDLAVEGVELDNMDEEKLDELLSQICVYARVSPEHKIRIVSAWQKRGNIVSMTGDGVNDAPALKKADIGVAMGITGTEVSKDASSMILTDDNFATIVKAVINGRNVYTNIKNAIKFLLSGNTAGILCVLYTSLLGITIPFLPVHLLFINLLTDSLPAIAIGMEPARRDLLEQKPRDPKDPILNRSLFMQIAGQGLLIAVFTMAAYYIGLQTSSALAQTMAFLTLSLSRLFHGFNCRGKGSIFKLGLKTNMYSVGAFGVGVILLAMVSTIPLLEKLFAVAPLSLANMGMVGLCAIIPTIVIQIVKVVRDRIK